MIDKNVVTRIVDEWLEGKDYFLVDVTIILLFIVYRFSAGNGEPG